MKLTQQQCSFSHICFAPRSPWCHTIVQGVARWNSVIFCPSPFLPCSRRWMILVPWLTCVLKGVPLQEDLAWLYPVGRCDIDYQAWTEWSHATHTPLRQRACRSCAMLSATRTCPPCLCSMCVMRQTISGTSVGRRVRAALSTLKE